MLEEQITRLEARIRELEHPELVSPSITLNPTGAAMQGHVLEGALLFYSIHSS